MKVEIEFVSDIVGHDTYTILLMYEDWCKSPQNRKEVIQDGFGNTYPKYCKKCKSKNQIVRPGKIQCNCK